MNRRRFIASSLAASTVYAANAFPAAFTESLSPADVTPELLDKLRNDPFRPQFHLLPRANWMNDPCAPRFHRGVYHMFFQYNPNSAVWGDMHWNHAVSPDLIHWKHQPIALAPTPGSYDSFGCFTGSVLPGMAEPTILYTGVTRSSPETIRGEGLREVQCLATSSDPDLLIWKKQEKPVIAAPPPGLSVTGFRDPCPWKEGEIWYMGVGSGFSKVGGAVLLYRSADGRKWEYLHPLAQGKWNEGAQMNPVDTGEMWECPDFFPLGGKHVLLYSAERKVYWEVGVFDKSDLKFHSETQGMLDHGYYYAMKSMLDEKGRRILWGWVEESRTGEQCLAAGWAGAMALPRVLSLGPDNRLRMDVPSEFGSLLHAPDVTIKQPKNAEAIGPVLAEAPIRNRAASISLRFDAAGAPFALELHADQSGAPFFAVKFSGESGKPMLSIGDKILSLSPDKDEISTIDFWLDGSVFEIFADSREAMTARDFTPAPAGIQVKWAGSSASLDSLTLSAVSPISKDRLTS